MPSLSWCHACFLFFVSVCLSAYVDSCKILGWTVGHNLSHKTNMLGTGYREEIFKVFIETCFSDSYPYSNIVIYTREL
jgi:hypothetical protein